ncbi:hypothetical protein FHL15_009883 [Xylaria flabelliformis]|uniref:Uncharacterized protein n=1 Tax=Xylaria flabelliformis TaxID=2512241 RepID=A0A553HMK3_9PEZI|nr:hypothetical protein FHL15_009883 [Xylaria flabelliformis]
MSSILVHFVAHGHNCPGVYEAIDIGILTKAMCDDDAPLQVRFCKVIFRGLERFLGTNDETDEIGDIITCYFEWKHNGSGRSLVAMSEEVFRAQMVLAQARGWSDTLRIEFTTYSRKGKEESECECGSEYSEDDSK